MTVRQAPLSSDQERQWLVDRLLAGRPGGDEPTVVRVRGALDIDALSEAWRLLAVRHESLRTTFPAHDGVPCQEVTAEPPDPLPVRLVKVGAEGLTGALAAVSHEVADPAVGALWRVSALRIAPDDHVLVLWLHHLIADLWSVAVLVEEFCTAYSALVGGRAVELPAVPVTPSELAGRQRARLTSARRERLRSWWRSALDGASAVALPADHPRPALPNLSSYVHDGMLDVELADGLRALARAHGTTLFAVLLAGFSALVSRWSGAPDLVVNSVGAGRHGRSAERAVGLLTQCLVLRVRVDGCAGGFAELVGRAANALLDAVDHANAPFADVVAIVDPGRDREPSPLRQLGLSLHNTPQPRAALRGLALDAVPVAVARPVGRTEPRGTSEADVWLEVFDHGSGGLGLRLQLDDVMFDPGSAVLVTDGLTRVLRAAVADPTVRVELLPIPRLPGPVLDAHPAPLPPAPSEHALRLVTLAVRTLLDLPADPRPDDNVFLLGATSLDASRLAAHLTTLTNHPIHLYDLMTARTPTAIAALLPR